MSFGQYSVRQLKDWHGGKIEVVPKYICQLCDQSFRSKFKREVCQKCKDLSHGELLHLAVSLKKQLKELS